MKSRIIYCGLAFLIMAVMLDGCQKYGLSDSSKHSIPTKVSPPLQLSNQYFPNKVGDSWTYTVTDTVPRSYVGAFRPDSIFTDTVKISVVGIQTKSDGTEVTLWQTIWPSTFYNGRIDTVRVTIMDDRVKINPNPIPISGNEELFVFPLKTGGGWRNGPDSSQVVSKEPTSVPVGYFDNVYQIHTTGVSFNYHLNKDLWFKPGVGIIKLVHSEGGFGLVSQTWNLVDYHVK